MASGNKYRENREKIDVALRGFVTDNRQIVYLLVKDAIEQNKVPLKAVLLQANGRIRFKRIEDILETLDAWTLISFMLDSWEDVFEPNINALGVTFKLVDKVRHIRNDYAHEKADYDDDGYVSDALEAISNLGVGLQTATLPKPSPPANTGERQKPAEQPQRAKRQNPSTRKERQVTLELLPPQRPSGVGRPTINQQPTPPPPQQPPPPQPMPTQTVTPTDLIPDVEFVENPEPRCACVLLVDVSTSMHGEKINQLNEGLVTFANDIRQDPLASIRTEVAIITFGIGVNIVQDFVTADQFVPPTLIANGRTNMAEGINFALDKIEERKDAYRRNGVDYYRPWLFLMTDGKPTERPAVVDAAATRLKQTVDDNGVAAFSVGVEGADMKKLREISPRPPFLLDGLNFQPMFQWLSRSMSRVSSSRTTDEIQLIRDEHEEEDVQAIRAWAVV